MLNQRMPGSGFGQTNCATMTADVMDAVQQSQVTFPTLFVGHLIVHLLTVPDMNLALLIAL